MATVRTTWAVATVLLVGCTTARGRVRDDVQRLAARAGQCESFIDFEDARQATHQALLAAGTTSDLLHLDAQLKSSQRTCARHTLSTLLARRESQGPGAVQAQLDAMARALDAGPLRMLVQGTLGDDPAVTPLLELALATAEVERTAAQRAARDAETLARWTPPVPDGGPVPTEDDTAQAQAQVCAARPPLEGLECLGELSARGLPSAALLPAMHTLAQRQAESTAGLLPAERSRHLDTFLGRLALVPDATVPAPLLTALRAAHTQVWPQVEAARTEGRVEFAAYLASPFLRLPEVAASARALREAAAAKHLAVASQATTRALAAALHRQVAHGFGGPEAPVPALESGRWDTARFTCATPLPRLLQPPHGLLLRLLARCRREGPPPAPPSPSAMKTFELEQSLAWERVDGEVLATCGGAVRRYPVAVRDVALDDDWPDALSNEGGGGPGQALRLRLESILREAAEACRAAREPEVVTACAALGQGDALDTEQHFAELALRLGRWPTCFAAWFETTYGVPLPPLAGARP